MKKDYTLNQIFNFNKNSLLEAMPFQDLQVGRGSWSTVFKTQKTDASLLFIRIAIVFS